MATYATYLKIVARLSIKSNVTEPQIRGYLADTKPKLDARLTSLVAATPPAAQAVLDDIFVNLKVIRLAPGLWEIYPKLVLTVSVADTITETQVRNFLEGYWDQAKADLRTLVGNAPPGAQAKILSWHVHRLVGGGDEVEV